MGHVCFWSYFHGREIFHIELNFQEITKKINNNKILIFWVLWIMNELIKLKASTFFLFSLSKVGLYKNLQTYLFFFGFWQISIFVSGLELLMRNQFVDFSAQMHTILFSNLALFKANKYIQYRYILIIYVLNLNYVGFWINIWSIAFGLTH